MTFRKDINGLRAIAVLAVVLYHFKIAGFSGGFIGVDIFFVISGYLMTGIIFSKMIAEKFSLVDFYIHRARRIIPALALLCMGVFLFGLFFIPTLDYREMLYSIQRSILFISNIFYAKTASYFDTPSQENWLLHTWSLSVEWQFYVIYPIILIFLKKFFSFRTIKFIVIVFAIISLLLCIIQTYISPTKAFFLLPYRAWEMLAGGIVFLFPLTLTSKLSKSLQYLGFILIICSVFFIKVTMPWPGYLALVPVIGTMLIIGANQQGLLLTNPISQWLGKISYSIYLWHWPFAVALMINGLIIKPLYLFYCFSSILILATLSYYLVERRVSIKKSKVTQIMVYFGIVAFVVYTVSTTRHLMRNNPHIRESIVAHDFNKINDPTTEKFLPEARYCLYSHDMKQFPECKLGEGEPSLILMGDSHAASIYPAIKKVNTKGSTLLWAHSSCPMIENIHFTDNRQPGCMHLFKQKQELLKTQYPNVPILFVNYLSFYIHDHIEAIYFNKPTKNHGKLRQQFQTAYINSLCQIAKNRPVYVLKPIPTAGSNIPKRMALSLVFHGTAENIINPISDYNEQNGFIINVMEQAQKQCNIHLIDPVPYFCSDNKNCRTSDDGNPLYFDNNHISRYASEQLAPIFKEIFTNTK